MRQLFTLSNIKSLQKHVYTLLGYNGRVSLQTLSKDTCSEITRLVGGKIKKQTPKARAWIAKGKIHRQYHDVLLITEADKTVVLDPKVWQFEKYKKSILLGRGKTVADTLALLHKKYGGTWHVSEQISGYTKQEISALEHTLSKTLSENRKAHLSDKVT